MRRKTNIGSHNHFDEQKRLLRGGIFVRFLPKKMIVRRKWFIFATCINIIPYSKVMYFIDLFAGLGGFNLALSSLGHECVFASELKEDLQKLYRINFPNVPIVGDIVPIDPAQIPAHEILCAGFPCQPFSQAGLREGFNDKKKRGNLFDKICEIVAYHRPRYIMLENVSNLRNHDHGKTWDTIKFKLDQLNYEVIEPAILSPHQFGIPQHRRRIFIVCENRDFGHLDFFRFPEPTNKKCNIRSIIDESDTEYIRLKEDARQKMNVWQEFMDLTISHGDTIPRFPIWAMEFGANYDYIDVAPVHQTIEMLRGKKGKLGKKITGATLEDCLEQLPVYAQSKTDKDTLKFPDWKISYIRQNREFYAKHKSWLDDWMLKIQDYENSHMKFEWNCGATEPKIENNIVQFRASGIRVKQPTYSPALNLVGTQIPIFPWIELPKQSLAEGEPSKGRYMTYREGARLQGMENLSFGNDDYKLPQSRIFDALGNAVNVEIVRRIAQNLLPDE